MWELYYLPHFLSRVLQTAGDRALTNMGWRIVHQGKEYKITRSIGAPFTLQIREVVRGEQMGSARSKHFLSMICSPFCSHIMVAILLPCFDCYFVSRILCPFVYPGYYCHFFIHDIAVLFSCFGRHFVTMILSPFFLLRPFCIQKTIAILLPYRTILWSPLCYHVHRLCPVVTAWRWRWTWSRLLSLGIPFPPTLEYF